MYFGSVRFFRHLIVGSILFVIIASISLNILFAFGTAKSRKEYDHLSADFDKLKSESASVPNLNLSDISHTPLSDSPSDVPTSNQADIPGSTLAYQSLYEDMYCEPPVLAENPDNTIYLTFDDGPSKYTQQVLNTLGKHNIKATFFIVGNSIAGNEDVLKAIAAGGHALGVHTYSHDYHAIYKSVEAYLADFYKAYSLIYQVTGVRPTVFRFPGGSINSYNQGVYQQIIAEMLRRGFVYYDWNVSAGDATGKATTETVKSAILDNVDNYSSSIVLLHDSKNVSVSVLDSVINELLARKYRFDKVTPSVTPVAFGYRD